MLTEGSQPIGQPPAGSATREVESFVTELHNVPEGWYFVLALAAGLGILWAVVWMYRHEGRVGASMGLRMLLAGLRCGVLVTLAVILLEPVRVKILRRIIDSYIVLLIDTSSSMDLADRYREEPLSAGVASIMGEPVADGVRRGDLVSRLLGRSQRAFLKDLARTNRVKVYTFSDEPELVGTLPAGMERKAAEPGEGEASSPFAAVSDLPIQFAMTGSATNMERSVRRAVESLGRSPVAAVVVLTDGAVNQGGDVESIAEYARKRDLPIHVVGIGDPTGVENIRVTEVLAPANAFQQDPFTVVARLSAEGFDGRLMRVDLYEQDAAFDSEGRLIGSEEVIVGVGGIIAPVTFHLEQTGVGRFVYTVHVPASERESLTDDNSKHAVVNVIESRMRVLMVAGGPSWDYQFVSRLLQRDDTFDVSCWLQSADLSAVRDGNTIIDHLPTAAEELFAYDVVILMDADYVELDEPWCKLLDAFVTDHGGGLLLTAGRRHTPSLLREPALECLWKLLPVTRDPDVDLILNRVGHYQTRGFPVEIPESSFGHPILQQADDPASTKLAWRGIGGVHWHYPVLRAKPVATVLMVDSDPRNRNAHGAHILSAVQFAGAGRTGFVGFDGTFRWRAQSETLFNRFWVQMVRYLAEGKLFGGAKRGLIVTDSDQFALGEAVTLSARLYDKRFEPLELAEVRASFEIAEHRGELTLTARPGRPGWYEGRFVPDRVGVYRVSVRLTDGPPGEQDEIIKDIRISRPNLEMLRPQADRQALVTLAEQSAGGRYFEVDAAMELPPLIPDLHEEISIRSRPTSLWDNGYMLTLLVGLLAVEWAIRKWRHLL